MTKLSFGFIVGGGDSYYKNLMRACESLERIKQDHEILIIDMEDRLSIDDPNLKIVNASREELKNEDARNWFQPHIWAERYNLYKHVETDHCIYLDTDTVVINDRVDELVGTMLTETNLDKRNANIAEAWSIVQNNLLTNPYKSKSKPKTLL